MTLPGLKQVAVYGGAAMLANYVADMLVGPDPNKPKDDGFEGKIIPIVRKDGFDLGDVVAGLIVGATIVTVARFFTKAA